MNFTPHHRWPRLGIHFQARLGRSNLGSAIVFVFHSPNQCRRRQAARFAALSSRCFLLGRIPLVVEYHCSLGAHLAGVRFLLLAGGRFSFLARAHLASGRFSICWWSFLALLMVVSHFAGGCFSFGSIWRFSFAFLAWFSNEARRSQTAD